MKSHGNVYMPFRFAFHLLLAYLVDHISIHLAFVICSLVSIALVISYLRLVLGMQFAAREAAIARRTEVLTGASEFPDLQEAAVAVLDGLGGMVGVAGAAVGVNVGTGVRLGVGVNCALLTAAAVVAGRLASSHTTSATRMAVPPTNGQNQRCVMAVSEYTLPLALKYDAIGIVAAAELVVVQSELAVLHSGTIASSNQVAD